MRRKGRRKYQVYYKGTPYGDPITADQTWAIRATLLNIEIKPYFESGYRAI